ncbi:twin-arginine translocase subunit TatC [Halorarum salinum]|uniref:Sec-independent protein translocase protein TatC n=1 Tax=Halorarum salinum TaxID=2743089 RepID=A0A7D5Q8I7_9EURY|nr:twin-arginine translocase subunit TatC [Halobaculum salinum]QLG60997.1 twin-arginine translocase subunit TatC [Halobaculum salinum]
MTEDAETPAEPTRSDGADESASGPDDDPDDPDAAANGAGEVDSERADESDDAAESGSDGEPEGVTESDGDAEGTGDAKPDERGGADGADDGNDADEAGRIEAVDPPGDPENDLPEGSYVGPEESDDVEGTRAEAADVADADGVEAGEVDADEEELTAAEKGMQTVENVGSAFAGGGEGPESDMEMPLTEHIEEMMRRLAAVFAVAGVVSGAVLFAGSVSPAVPSAAELIRYFWDFHVGLPATPGGPGGHSPYVYGPLEYLLTKLKVVALAGLLAGLPMFVFQTYGFMRPGLYPHERRYYIAAIPTSLVLGIVGAAFAHFAVLPFIFDYFISYTVGTAELRFGLKETFNLILIMMGYFAIVFQIPLFIQLAIMMGVVTRQWLEDRRLIFWGAFLGLALTFITVDPTGFAPIIVVATMIVLFEGTLALLRWTGN